MSLVQLSIDSVVVGAGPVSSLLILRPTHRETSGTGQLPIRIGAVEAASIGMGMDKDKKPPRPLTHDLLLSIVDRLGATLNDIVIHNVRGPTFYAHLRLTSATGDQIVVDARPSDAIALAVRLRKPMYAEQQVLDMATLPDFAQVEREERKREEEAFHDFIEGLTPDDFAQ